MAHPDQTEQATRRRKALRAARPHAVEAHFDRRARRIVIRLSNRIDLAFSPADAEGLEEATPAQLSAIEVSPSGFGIYFPRLDADIYIPALLEGVLGSKQWMASRLGSLGGQSKSKAKTAAARKNGSLGGRPRKKAAAVA
ncbi:MAG TPA: DUF2442 domain-containing protein [Terracidiphilus sp.]|jgi:hypothetical protein|nr:DUF2442 domain-containing protein [Terracidiphilus sp.]